MDLLYSIIYDPKINQVIRNLNYFLSPILPEKVKIHPAGLINVRVKNHNSFKLKTNQTSYVTRELFWKGSQNYEYTPIFIKLIQKVNNFFDIGSSIGYFSILGANVNKNLKVEAFEPSTGSMIYLSENVKINYLSDRINVNYLALSDKTGQIDFCEIRNRKYPTIYNLSGEHNIGTKPNLKSIITKINSDTLDSFVLKKKITNIDLMKLDTEGCEDLVLKNGSLTIGKFKPIIICEILFDRIESQLEKVMLEHQYEFYNHIGNGLKKVNSIQRKIDNGVRNCFIVHPTKRYLIDEFIL
ncbi:FkbM family methyltransferase [Autumnicola edwardsiae]|uniref:FkbM family methyltransferase n=1 Tax=Autumnicola edwardsiae TaxID=3075594 RepID=A0ABU3CZL0_9FLAO|nr:FkbM family methyltransferase [Zunongwangia sp. F297]MDT0651686.1 FkbM family methyltransferase [Zunongwangia sp. F297]